MFFLWSTVATAHALQNITVKFQKDTILIANNSNQTFALKNASVEFDYAGKIFAIQNVNNGQSLPFSSRANVSDNKTFVYAVTLSRTNDELLPKQTLKLTVIKNNAAEPNHVKLTAAPTPQNVTVKFYNSAWKETITVCNTSGKNIPLHNLELSFNYTVPMPTVIWGEPWANWKVASQTANQVVLIGGTDATPDLPPDPYCMRPLEIIFTASPTTPAPTGPFVFKAETGTTPPPPGSPCPFDNTKECKLTRDILNDTSPAGLRYYGPTNYDHRFSGEINIFDATLVTPYTDSVNAPGQIKLTANRVNAGLFKSGEIMTRRDLEKPPYSSPKAITPFTTNDIEHGYIEGRVKLPKCDVSDDGLCQNGTAPEAYHRGMWPSIWLLPTMDTNWPANGEIDIFEAYKRDRGLNETTAALHFNGNDPRCGGNDCKFIGFHLPSSFSTGPFFNAFHTWGFEWQPDPKSTKGGVILTGYFDNKKQWGPLATDSLPADGPNAFARGFHDPNGGFYFITALALGGGYAGPPNAHMQSASMFIQSVKAYTVSGGTTPPPQGTCLPPANVKSSWTADKKNITLTWEKPANSAVIETYQVNDWMNRQMFKGTALTFTDKTLPGTNGKFTYFLLSNCAAGPSAAVKVDVNIT